MAEPTNANSPGRSVSVRGTADLASTPAHLKALLEGVDDPETRDVLTQTFYQLTSGDPTCLTVQLCVFLTGLVNAHRRLAVMRAQSGKLPTSNGQAVEDAKLAKGMAELKALVEQALRETSELRKEVSLLAAGAQPNGNLPGVVAQQTVGVLEPRMKAYMNDLVTRCRVLPSKYFWWLLSAAGVLLFVLGIVVHMWWAKPAALATARVAPQVREVQPDPPRPLPRVNPIDPTEFNRDIQEANRQLQAIQRQYPQARGTPSPTPKR
jgi:hypothetical protein